MRAEPAEYEWQSPLMCARLRERSESSAHLYCRWPLASREFDGRTMECCDSGRHNRLPIGIFVSALLSKQKRFARKTSTVIRRCCVRVPMGNGNFTYQGPFLRIRLRLTIAYLREINC